MPANNGATLKPLRYEPRADERVGGARRDARDGKAPQAERIGKLQDVCWPVDDAIALPVRQQAKSWPINADNARVWQGEADNVVFPTAAAYMAAKLPHNKLHMIPDAGHLTVVARHAENVFRELLAAE